MTRLRWWWDGLDPWRRWFWLVMSGLVAALALFVAPHIYTAGGDEPSGIPPSVVRQVECDWRTKLGQVCP